MRQAMLNKLKNKGKVEANGYTFPKFIIAVMDFKEPVLRYFKGTVEGQPHLARYAHPTKKMNKARTSIYNAITGETVGA